MSTSKSFAEASKAGYEATSKAIQSVKVDHIPAAVGNYVRNHPYSTVTGVILAVPMMLPASVAVPVLGGLGFSSTGPVAGSAAAAYQSAHGATALFSGLQSAAMTGYGTPYVYGAVQALAGAGGAVVLGKEWIKSKL